MTDCSSAALIDNGPPPPVADDRRERADLAATVRCLDDGRGECLLSIPTIKCGHCIAKIEHALDGCDGVVSARVNLTLRRLRLTLTSADTDLRPAIRLLASLGHPATLIDTTDQNWTDATAATPTLLKSIAVAGFGAANVMLMSVAVWAGADGATREGFHLLSALIAVPVVAYAGQPFFGSALGAIRRGQLNMDVPIALGVLLALGLSLSETARGGEHVFYDAAVTLLFFLLIGRYLDQLMRDRARSAVTGLARLAAKGAMRVCPDRTLEYVTLDQIKTGMDLRIAAGERIPVDVRINRGASDIDRSLVTGESVPVAAEPGDVFEAGALNLSGALDVVALRPANESYLAEIMRMLEAAECGRGRYVRIADRAARLYAPIVHLLALATFMGWMLTTGGDWHTAIFVAISVLIITCPCALGLAVPVAHVVGASRLLSEGILMKDGSALERLAEIDTVVFDKTGTLTTGTPTVTAAGPSDAQNRAAAATLALHSSHPAAGAVAAFLNEARPSDVESAHEVPGYGIEGIIIAGNTARLGRTSWVAEIADETDAVTGGPSFAFRGGALVTFTISEAVRPGARDAIAELQAAGMMVEILSGDGQEHVDPMARHLGVARSRHGTTAVEKIAHLDRLRSEGHRVLMVGDGLNDAAALAAAHVSMAPASASDAGRLAADIVFTHEKLDAVPRARDIAIETARTVRQNFVLAIVYNTIAIPLAVAGQVTPLIAALAMSLSSIIVVANSLRLNAGAASRRDLARHDRKTLQEAAA